MKNEYFYCYNKVTNNWIFIEDERELLNFLAKGAANNFLIRNASLSFDKEIFGRYVFCNKDFDIFDVRDYEDAVKQYKRKDLYSFDGYDSYKNYKKHKYSDSFHYGQIIYTKAGRDLLPYAYRKDPVPCLRKYWKYTPEKKVKYKQIIATLKNPEMKEFIRTKHYATLINGAYDYDDFYGRCNQKSWKKKKIKHQWEKNL